LVSTTDRVFRRATEVQVGVLVVCVCCAGGILLRKVVIDLWKDISCGRKFHQPPPQKTDRFCQKTGQFLQRSVQEVLQPTGLCQKTGRFLQRSVQDRPVQMNNRPGSLFPDRDFPRAPFVHASEGGCSALEMGGRKCTFPPQHAVPMGTKPPSNESSGDYIYGR